MNAKKEDIEKFDAYLQGSLTAEENLLFESALATNAALKESFELHKTLVEAIAQNRENHLRDILKEQRSLTFIGSNTWSKKFTLVAAAIMLIGISAMFISYLKKTDMLHPLATNKIEENTDIDNTDEPSNYIESMDSNNLSPKIADNDAIAQNEEITENFEVDPQSIEELDENLNTTYKEKGDDDMERLEGKEVVKNTPQATNDYKTPANERISADKLIKSVNTTIRYIDTTAQQMDVARIESTSIKKDRYKGEYEMRGRTDAADSSLAKAKTDVQKSSLPAQINITYFKSPLNYKGYSYANNKITVYGLKDTTSTLFSFGEQLYLKNSGIIYQIKPSPVFTDYIIIKEKAIIERLK